MDRILLVESSDRKLFITYDECLLIYKALIRSYSFTYATDDEEMQAMVNVILERPAGRLILSKFQKEPSCIDVGDRLFEIKVKDYQLTIEGGKSWEEIVIVK